MKYKALIVDLDGTTVIPFTNIISDRVRDAIHKAHDFVLVSVATGRLLTDVLPIISRLDLTGTCIVDNGAQLYDPLKKEIVRTLSLDEDVILPVFEILKKKDVRCHIFDGENEVPLENRADHKKAVSIYVPDISPQLVQELTDELSSISAITTHRLWGTKVGLESLEVTNVEATKQYGIFEFAKIHNIDLKEIIGVGDGYNDFPLLMACGLKIAMGNAVDELKAVADFIAPKVEDDGLAVVIEKLLLD